MDPLRAGVGMDLRPRPWSPPLNLDRGTTMTLPLDGTTLRPLRAAAFALALLLASAARAGDDLPSPDAMALGVRMVPAAIVQGYRAGIEDDVLERVLGARVPAGEQPAVRARARKAMAPLLDEAFPPELLAGLGAQFLAAHYPADELRTLRARDESPLGRKLRDFEDRTADIVADSPASLARARDALARATFSAAEQRDLDAFERTPLARKGLGLAPQLAAFFVDALDQRWRSVRPELEPRLRAAVEGVLQK
jgi:hypothetical protein